MELGAVGFWLAGNERMSKKIATIYCIVGGYMGTAARIDSFLPSLLLLANQGSVGRCSAIHDTNDGRR